MIKEKNLLSSATHHYNHSIFITWSPPIHFFTGTLLLLLSIPLRGITGGYEWLRMVRVGKGEYWWLPLGKGGYEWLRGLRGGALASRAFDLLKSLIHWSRSFFTTYIELLRSNKGWWGRGGADLWSIELNDLLFLNEWWILLSLFDWDHIITSVVAQPPRGSTQFAST